MQRDTTFRLAIDSKRRTTWPVQLLELAGLAATDELIVRVEEEGRLVVESRDAVRRRVRRRAAAGRARIGFDDSTVDSLLSDRRADAAGG